MTDRTTVNLDPETRERLKSHKPDDMNWPAFMRVVAQDFENSDVGDQIQSNMNASECNAGDMANRVINRIDDLEAELPRKVAEELR